MDKEYYTRINRLCKQIERSAKEGKEINYSPIVKLYNDLSTYFQSLREEIIQISMVQSRLYGLLPSEFKPKCISTKLSPKQLNDVYDRLIELDYIEGSRENFLSIFDPMTPAPSPLIKWKKTGRNKELDIVSMLNFILLVGGRDNDLEEDSELFFGVTFSKTTRSRAGIQTDLRKLGLLLGISPE